MTNPATVRDDVCQKHPQLFGTKSVNGVRVNVEELIGRMVDATLDDFPRALATRRRMILDPPIGGLHAAAWSDSNKTILDPEGKIISIADIRQGMIDNFLGRPTDVAWRLNSEVPVPEKLLVPGMQGTGPFIELGMAMGAINAARYGASSWMPDSEDAGGDYRAQLYQQWQNLRDLLAGQYKTEEPWAHPSKTYKSNHPLVREGRARVGEPRTYSIQLDPDAWPALVHRVPGIHLRNRQITYQGRQVPATIPALVIYALNNLDSLRSIGQYVAFYMPKIETPEEALIIGKLLRILEEAMNVQRGSVKLEMLNERGEYSIAQPQIMWVLRKNLIGPNVGRWDYLNSLIEMFKDASDMVFPDPHTITMTADLMTEYTRRNALLTLLVGGMPIGGMAAQMQNPNKPENDLKAWRAIWFDKLRERLTGMFDIDGEIHDTYRQSWVATTIREYVQAGVEPLATPLDDLQSVVDKLNDQEADILVELGLLTRDGAGKSLISPYPIQSQELTVELLFSAPAFERLFHRPQGDISETGIRLAIYYATEYMYQQLQGNNAAAIADPLTGMRFMNDLATYEIFWHWLWTVVHHQAEITKEDAAIRPGGDLVSAKGARIVPETLKLDGALTLSKGDRIDENVFSRLLKEREDVINALFVEFDQTGVYFNREISDLVLDIARRQVLHPQWIKYGSRVLLSVIEVENRAQRRAILDAIFSSSREEVVRRVESCEWDRSASAAHDYVYDVF